MTDPAPAYRQFKTKENAMLTITLDSDQQALLGDALGALYVTGPARREEITALADATGLGIDTGNDD